MSTAPRYLPNYSVADYQQWEGDWELWQGIPIAITPSPFGIHQDCSLRLARSLLDAIEQASCHAVVLQETDWVVSDHTVVRSDVVVLCGEVPARHIEQVPAVVAEITSESTAERDRTAKFELYQEKGVGYYLLASPETRALMIYELDRQQTFQQIPFADEVLLAICDGCELRFNPHGIVR